MGKSIQDVEGERNHWQQLCSQQEELVMEERRKLHEALTEKENFENLASSTDFTLQTLVHALKQAESLSDFQAIVEDEYNLYGMH